MLFTFLEVSELYLYFINIQINSKRKKRDVISKNLPEEENQNEEINLSNNYLEEMVTGFNKTIIKEELLYSCSNLKFNSCKETVLLTGLDFIRSGVNYFKCVK